MEPRVSLITLGSVDLARARGFYARMGFSESSASTPEVAFFAAGGVVLALFGKDELAADAGLSAGDMPAFRGVALAHNVRERSEVAAILCAAEAAGGTIVKPAADVFWGGHSGYFADPDGHVWEVAWNPHWPLDANGKVMLPA